MDIKVKVLADSKSCEATLFRPEAAFYSRIVPATAA